MWSKLLSIFFLIVLLDVLQGQDAFGQLLEDRNKLKRERRKGKGFALYKKNVAKRSPPPAAKANKKTVKPKYSRPRLAGRVRAVSPRYSIQTGGQGSDRRSAPRYSRPKKRLRVVIVNPRYSRYAAGSGMNRVVNPRYTQDIAGLGYKGKVKIRYSKYAAGLEMDRAVNPRFSVSPLTTYKYRPPKSASGSMVYGFPKNLRHISKKRNHREGAWDGPWIIVVKRKKPKSANFKGKAIKPKKGRDRHPSANHLLAKGNKSRLARDLMQKASVLWVRVHINQTDPKAIRKKPAKLKFDKNEAEIWNNKEREYTKQ